MMSRDKDHTHPEKALPVRWLTKSQLSAYLDIPENTINQYICDRVIPYVKVPRSNKVRFDIAAIDEWLLSGCVLTAQDELKRQSEENSGQTQAPE